MKHVLTGKKHVLTGKKHVLTGKKHVLTGKKTQSTENTARCGPNNEGASVEDCQATEAVTRRVNAVFLVRNS